VNGLLRSERRTRLNVSGALNHTRPNGTNQAALYGAHVGPQMSTDRKHIAHTSLLRPVCHRP
jgi:hypothetical protein